MSAKKGDWVRIYKEVLPVGKRSDNLPEDTKKVPLEMWDKGFLNNDTALIGEEVSVTSIIGREITGKLAEVNPVHDVNYGQCITETLYIGMQLREMLGD